MKDSFYPIEIKLASKSGWSTPQEAAGIWRTPYAREGLTMHWWGDGSGANNHDNITNYFLGQAAAGNKSVNYVVSDNKITLMVSPDNIAWCSNNGNPTTISIEHQPTLGAEGYKKSGWLVDQLEERYGRLLSIYPHSKWIGTACPGSIDLNRIRVEANKWKTGVYTTPPPVVTPAPPTTPPAPTVQITYSVLPTPVKYIINKNTDLWNFNTATWAGFKSVKKMNQGEIFEVFAIADNHSTKSQYGVTKYSFDKKITNGVNMKDLNQIPEQPVPTPPPVQVDPPKPPATVDKNVVIAFLEGLIASIKEFITKLKG
jgi:hypothetical protein